MTIEQVDPLLPTGSDTSPIAHDRMPAEQIGLNGDGVEPSHISCRVDPEEHSWMVVVCHAELSHGLNPATNEFGESITCHRFMELIDAVAGIDLKPVSDTAV